MILPNTDILRTLKLAALALGACAIFCAPITSAADGNATSAPVVFGPTVNGFSLSAQLASPTVKVGDPIALTFSIRNGGAPIAIWPQFAFGLSGTGPDDTPIAKVPRKYALTGGGPSSRRLDTGEAFTVFEADVGQRYDFSKPGRYTMYFFTQVRLPGQFAGPPYSQLTSNTVTLIVK